MGGRYSLTVTYDEPNPDYQPGASAWGDRQPERLNVTVLMCSLTPEQFERLKAETLASWRAAMLTERDK